jgi:hypothetical protein
MNEVTEQTLRDIEARRHEILEQRKAWQAVQKYIDGIVDTLKAQVDATFDEWERVFNLLHPDFEARYKEIQAGVSTTEPSGTASDPAALVE